LFIDLSYSSHEYAVYIDVVSFHFTRLQPKGVSICNCRNLLFFVDIGVAIGGDIMGQGS
jgi:hypothetical protein